MFEFVSLCGVYLDCVAVSYIAAILSTYFPARKAEPQFFSCQQINALMLSPCLDLEILPDIAPAAAAAWDASFSECTERVMMVIGPRLKKTT